MEAPTKGNDMTDIRRVPGGGELIRVVIVEEKLLFAEALDIALSREGLSVTRVTPGLHRSTSMLLTAVLRARPTIVLVDVDLDDTGTGPRLVTPLSRTGVAVVALIASSDAARWGECLRHGARTVLPLTCTMRDVVTTIRLLSAGRPVIERAERERLVADYHREKAEIQEMRQRLDQLTNRERAVLGLLREGLPVSEIATRCSLAESTVRTQVKAILAKLGVSSQLAAVGATYRAAWTPPRAVEHAL